MSYYLLPFNGSFKNWNIPKHVQTLLVSECWPGRRTVLTPEKSTHNQQQPWHIGTACAMVLFRAVPISCSKDKRFLVYALALESSTANVSSECDTSGWFTIATVRSWWFLYEQWWLICWLMLTNHCGMVAADDLYMFDISHGWCLVHVTIISGASRWRGNQAWFTIDQPWSSQVGSW